MTELFGRRAVVEIDNLVIENLDIRFDISAEVKNLNKGKIDIYNLNAAHRQKIEEEKDLPVTLKVGYSDGEMGTIFKGIMRDGFSIRDATDWITTLRTGDGDKAPQARVNKSYSKGSSFETMWKDCADALKKQGIDIGESVEVFKKTGSAKNAVTQLLHGGVVQGSALKEMRRLARTHNLDVMIQDQELIVTEIDKALATTAVVLTPTTGLISSPQKGTKGELKVRALLVPGLRPKRKVHIKSALVDGVYVIEKASYKGETSANDWYADLTCKELK